MSARDEWAGFQEVGRTAPKPTSEWDGFREVAPANRGRKQAPAAVNTAQIRRVALAATGHVHDGDTFRLADGRNARLYGADAFELAQQGRDAAGRVVPLGQQARTAFLPFAQPGATIAPTGGTTYGRPVVSVENGGRDAASALLHDGMAVATPRYLKADSQRLMDYLQLERLARLNRRGAHAGTFQTPEDYRRDPKEPAPGEYGNAHAVFFDEPTPSSGLAEAQEKALWGIWTDFKKGPQDYVAYAKANGIQLDPAVVAEQFRKRDRDQKAGGNGIPTVARPRVLTNPGDGATGAAVRGLLDPINFLDEFGGLANTVLPTPERENIWSSDRRFGDILANNTEQWRSILDYDDANHPYARFAGQLASGVAMPGASVEGVGLAAARSALRRGASRFAATQAARRAFVGRLGAAGAIEGGLAGAGQGETARERFTGTAIGAPAGGILAVAAGAAAPQIASLVGRPFSRVRGRASEQAAESFTDGAVDTARAIGNNDALELRVPDRFDLPAIAPRQRDRINIAPGARGIEPVQAPFDTSAPIRPAPPAREIGDVMPEVEAWAARAGARRADGTGYPDVMLHGSPRSDIDQFDPYGKGGYGLFGAGTYLTDTAEIAASYSKKGLSKAARDAATDRTMYAVRHVVKNPLDMDAPADRLKWEDAARRVMGDYGDEYFNDLPANASNERFWREVEDYLTGEQVTASEGRETMDALVRSLGHDGIMHIGGGRVSKDGPRHRVVIALDPEQTEIVDRLSVGSLLNPPAPRAPDWIDANASVRTDRARDRLEMPMASEMDQPALYGPSFADDAEWPGQRVEGADAAQPRDLMAPDAERRAAADRLNPSDVMPLPNNAVDGIEEAARIERGRYADVRAGDEAGELTTRYYRHPVTGASIPKKGPLDLVAWLRTQGGIRAQGGELEHAGIDNAARKMDFAGGEQRLGPLVSNSGMTYDEAAERAWEAGNFPDFTDRPTVREFLDVLTDTHNGRGRAFTPDDYAEVERFEGARQARWDVEQARDQGAPLTSDRAGPVDMADLDANAPPIRAYEEWGENAPNLAGNIRLDKLDSPQAIKRALVQTERVTGGFDAARRGRITQAETESLAADLGMTADDLLKRRKGQAFNAEEALAARQILARSATDLVNMARGIARIDNPGDEAEAAFREAWLRHAAIQEQVAGMTAEAGRALQQFRQTADSRDTGRVLSSLGEMLGGPDRLKDVAGKIVDLEDAGTTPGGINRFALKALSPTWKDRAVELYINSLLSGPQTHVVNILSNTLTSLAQIPEHAAGAAVGAVRRALPGQADTDRIMFSEIGARAAGMVTGAKEGMRAAARAFLTGNSSDAASKVENDAMQAIPGVAGSVIRTPTRLLSAEDELFKGVARRMELSGLAIRQAKAEGRKGKAARDRAAELMLNPPDDMLKRSFDYARYLTFQTPLEHGSAAAGLSRATQRRQELKLLLPFIRTPMNMLKFAAERSPAAPIMRSWRREYDAGGARRDMAVARMMLGTGIGAAMYEMAAAGQITGGGPSDPNLRRVMMANGWQPYSLRIGDTYYSYARLDPFSTTIGTAADLHELSDSLSDGEKEGSAMMLGAAILNNLSSKTWLSGLSSALEAVNDPDRYLSNFVARTAGAIAVPAIVAQTARATDPIMREARSPINRIRSRVPGLSNDLYPRRDVFGAAMRQQGGVGPDFVSPIWTSTARNDPTLNALEDSGVRISLPQRKYGSGRNKVEWTPEQYDRLQQVTGAMASNGLASLVASPRWKAMDAEARQDAVGKVMTSARKSAKAIVLGGHRSPETRAPIPATDPFAGFKEIR